MCAAACCVARGELDRRKAGPHTPPRALGLFSQSGTPINLRTASMSLPSPVKQSRQMTRPVPLHARHATLTPPIATYPPTPSQFGHGTARESAHTEQPKARRQRRCNDVGSIAGGSNGVAPSGTRKCGCAERTTAVGCRRGTQATAATSAPRSNMDGRPPSRPVRVTRSKSGCTETRAATVMC